MKRTKSPLIRAAVLASTLFLGASSAVAQYEQKNLVSNQTGMAIRTDAQLINGWGLAFFPHGPFWVADEGTGVSTVYGPHDRPIPLVVTIPPAPGQPLGSPTGMIANPTSKFVISKNGKSGPALFIFDTGDGTISGWNPDVDPNNAVIMVDYSAAKPNRPLPAGYTGLAIGQNSHQQDIIYAADFNNGDIDMFDGNFHFLGSFTDPAPPLDVYVYGVQNINGKLFAAFASYTPQSGGAVAIFDTDGNLLRRFTYNDSRGPLQAPWGIALAPANFGVFSNALLIGNVQGDHVHEGGKINAFDLNTGAWLGHMLDVDHNPIEIGGLWALAFGTDKHANGKTNELFFTAGPTFPPHADEYTDGLFGVIVAKDHDDHDDPDDSSQAP